MGDLAEVLRSMLSSTIPTSRKIGFKKFDLAVQCEAEFPEFVEKMVVNLFRPDTSEKAKREALRECAVGTASDQIHEALEEHALEFAAQNGYSDAPPADGQIASGSFISPIKGKKLAFYGQAEGSAQYKYKFDDLRRLCIKKVLGPGGLSSLQDRLESLQLSDNGSFVSHKRRFEVLIDAYIATGGAAKSSNPRQYCTWFYRSLPTCLTELLTHFEFDDLDAAVKAVESASKLLRMRASASRPAKKVLSPKVAGVFDAGLSRNPVIASFSGPSLTIQVPADSDRPVRCFADNLSKVGSTKQALDVLNVYLKTFTDNAESIDVNDALILDGDKKSDFNVNDCVQQLTDSLQNAQSVPEVLCSIHHLLPDSVLKETSRTTKVVTSHALKGVDAKELRRLKSLKRKADAPKHASSSDEDLSDDDDDNAAKGNKNLKKGRPGLRPRRGSTDSAMSVQTMNTALAQALARQQTVFDTKIAAQNEHLSRTLASTVANACAVTAPRFPYGGQYPNPLVVPQHSRRLPLAPPPPRPPTLIANATASAVSSSSDYVNKNTPLNRTERPFYKNSGWKGCKRCWATDHFASSCPPVLQGLPFCRFCLADNHVIDSCPELQKKTCNVCHSFGHSASYCPKGPPCSRCGVPGHPVSRCRQQPN